VEATLADRERADRLSGTRSPGPILSLLTGDGRFDRGDHLGRVGLDLRLEAIDDPTVLADQELGEVPLDLATELAVLLG
jgi:hypothetical protein